MKNRKGFTLIELLTVVILLGVIMVIAIPSVKNLTYNQAEKKYRVHEKIVTEAAKVYAKNYRGELNNNDADCFNIPYQSLLEEDLVEEEGITCEGSIILTKRSKEGYNYENYLNCYDETGKLIHESEPIPLSCKGVNGEFKVSYVLTKDGESGKEPYTEGDWTKYIYGEYNSSSPYHLPIARTEYSMDLINWISMVNQRQTYTNYNGNIFVRAVDEGENLSEATRHLIRGDSLGPEFQLTTTEDSVLATDDTPIEISIVKESVKDSGVGIDVNGPSYSYDNGLTWISQMKTLAKAGTETTISAKDNLGNVSIVTNQTLHACTPTALTAGTPGTATKDQILTGKEAWVNGKKVTGTMPNRGSVTKTLNPGDSYTIPAGYHDGTGTVSASSLASNTSATAGAEHILNGKTAWVNGTRITGTMPNRGELNWKPATGTTYAVPAGYYSGGTLDSRDAYNAGSSAGYNTGYSAGSEAGYNTGYTAGVTAGKNEVINHADTYGLINVTNLSVGAPVTYRNWGSYTATGNSIFLLAGVAESGSCGAHSRDDDDVGCRINVTTNGTILNSSNTNSNSCGSFSMTVRLTAGQVVNVDGSTWGYQSNNNGAVTWTYYILSY